MTSTHSDEDWFDDDWMVIYKMIDVMIRLGLAGNHDVAKVLYILDKRRQMSFGEL